MAETRLAVFDLDGTLVDSAPDLAAAVAAVLAGAGLARPREDQVRAWIGNGARVMLARALAWAGAAEDGVVERLYPAFLAAYEDHLADRTALYPGMAEALDVLAARGLTLAVATNKSERLARRLLRALGLTGRFAAVVGGDSVGQKKPAPAPLLAAARAAGCGAHAAAMVGDTALDVLAARAAGMCALAVAWGYGDAGELASAGPDELIANAGELPAALARAAGFNRAGAAR